MSLSTLLKCSTWTLIWLISSNTFLDVVVKIFRPARFHPVLVTYFKKEEGHSIFLLLSSMFTRFTLYFVTQALIKLTILTDFTFFRSTTNTINQLFPIRIIKTNTLCHRIWWGQTTIITNKSFKEHTTCATEKWPTVLHTNLNFYVQIGTWWLNDIFPRMFLRQYANYISATTIHWCLVFEILVTQVGWQ